MNLVLPIVGTVLILLAAQDVFSTVLFPASGHGVIRKPLARLIWRCFAVPARRMPVTWRRSWLSYSGPVQITVTLLVWFVLLWVGWSLIYLPGLGSGIHAASGPTDRSWTTALYYSGYSLATLGTGDVVPETSGYRLLTVLEAGTGFGTVTMVISYFLSVYSTLPTRNAFAQGLHFRTRATDDAVQLIVGLGHTADLSGLRQELDHVAGFLRHTFQTHHSYPVLRYFHFRDPAIALPRVLLTVLDLVTLVPTTLDGRYAALLDGPELFDVRKSARLLMRELQPAATGDGDQPTADERAGWRARHAEAMQAIAASGVAVRGDRDRAADEYADDRAQWNGAVRRLAATLLYEWEAVGPSSPS